MGIERYVEKMCLANARLKEKNLISKWKLAQPNREKSPELERLLRERYQEGHHHNAFTPRARQHARGGKGGPDLSRNGTAHHPDMHRARTSQGTHQAPASRWREAARLRQADRERRLRWYGLGRPNPDPGPTPGEQLASLGGAIGLVGGVGALGRSIYHSETTCPNCGERARPCLGFAWLCSLTHASNVALQAPPAWTATVASKPPLWKRQRRQAPG